MNALIGKVFNTHTDVLNAAQALAKEYGFAVTTASSTPGHHIYIKCIHGGQYQNTRKLEDEERKICRTLVRSGCPWKMYASISAKHGHKFLVRKVAEDADHSHNLADDPTIYYQHRKPDISTDIRVRSITRHGVKLSQIYNEIRGDDGTPSMKMKDIYNFRGKMFKIAR
ncbi:hypothetical protein EC973_005513, partial [Apophysomyces ossiformis]